MFKVSRRSEYALIALGHLSRRPSDALVPVAEVAAAEQLPPDLLAKVLQSLKRAGIVEASKGAGGGYRLSRPIAEIRFLDVVRPFEDQIAAAESHLAGLAHHGTSDLGQSKLSPERADALRAPLAFLHAFVLRQFEGLTVDMCLAARMPALGAPPKDAGPTLLGVPAADHADRLPQPPPRMSNATDPSRLPMGDAHPVVPSDLVDTALPIIENAIARRRIRVTTRPSHGDRARQDGGATPRS